MAIKANKNTHRGFYLVVEIYVSFEFVSRLNIVISENEIPSFCQLFIRNSIIHV